MTENTPAGGKIIVPLVVLAAVIAAAWIWMGKTETTVTPDSTEAAITTEAPAETATLPATDPEATADRALTEDAETIAPAAGEATETTTPADTSPTGTTTTDAVVGAPADAVPGAMTDMPTSVPLDTMPKVDVPEGAADAVHEGMEAVPVPEATPETVPETTPAPAEAH